MQLKIQDCGCIALPDELAQKLGMAAGSVFEVITEGENRLVLTRSSPRVTNGEICEKVICPVL